MQLELSGKVALVTGSGRGLGRAIAEALARAGADVAIHDLDAKAPSKYGEAEDLESVRDAIGAFGVRATAVTGNIGDIAALRDMERSIASALGPVDILVNCAGGDIGAAGGKPNPNTALGISVEDIHTLVNNNLIGTILACQVFCPGMVQRGAGAVVNIASAAAHFGTSPEVVYSTLKAAVVHYTRCLAYELRPTGVRVNAVSPGPTKSARFLATRKTDPAMMDSSGKSLARYGEPSEIADAVVFLTGPRATFVHGQALRVDGGLTLYAG